MALRRSSVSPKERGIHEPEPIGPHPDQNKTEKKTIYILKWTPERKNFANNRTRAIEKSPTDRYPDLPVLGSLKGTSFIVLNVADGSVDKYANPTPNSNGKTAMPSTDSNTDIEVEFNAAGQAVFVTTGIHAGIDTVSKGCDNKGWVLNAITVLLSAR